jgi:hypothetical protein
MPWSILPFASGEVDADSECAQPADQIPVHPVHQVQDWDDPEGAIDWNALRDTFDHLKRTGELPSAHQSHDHMNWQAPVHIPDELFVRQHVCGVYLRES